MVLGKIVKSYNSNKDHRVIIRWVKPDDLKLLLNYVNGLIAEDTFVQVSGKPMTLDEEKAYLEDALDKIQKGKKIHLVVEVDGQFAGSGEVRFFDKRKSHVGEIGISISASFREEGIGTKLMESLIDEARSAGLKMLVLNCFENNLRALHTYEKVGFMKSGIVPGMLFYKNEYIGEVSMYKKL